MGREDLEKAWKLTHPDFGSSAAALQALADGRHPRAVLPADEPQRAAFEVDEVTPDEVWLGVLLTPKEGAGEAAGVRHRAQGAGAGAKQGVARQLLDAKVTIPVPGDRRRAAASHRRPPRLRLLLRLTARPRRPGGVGDGAGRAAR